MKKAFLIATIVAVLGLISLALYVESDAFGDRLRPLVARPLLEVLGPGSRVGRVKATVLPLVLEVRDISVPSNSSEGVIATRKIRVYVNPLPLLWKRLSITSITVLEPRVSGVRSSQGTIDLAAVLGTIRKNIARLQEQGPSAYSVSVRTVTIEDGTVELTDEASGVKTALNGLHAKAILRSIASEGIVRLSRGSLVLTVPSYPRREGSIRGTIAFKGTSLSFSDLEVRSRLLHFALSGTLTATPNGPIDLRVETRMGKGALGALSGIFGAQVKDAFLDAAATISGTFTEPELSGTAAMGGIAFKDVLVSRAGLDLAYARGAFRVEGRDWRLERQDQHMNIDRFLFEATYSVGLVQITRAFVQAEDTEAEASGTIGLQEGYDLAVAVSSAGTGTVLRFMSGLDASGTISLSGSVKGTLSSPAFDGTVSAGPIRIRSVTFEGVSGTIRFRDKTLSLIGATIRQDGSRYLLDGTVSFAGADPYYQARLSVIRSDVVNIVALFYEPLPLDLSASGELTFSGTNKAFTGQGHLDLGAGTAYGESFEHASLQVELTRSRIVFSRVLVEKGGGRIDGRGWIEFRGAYYANIESAGLDLSAVDHLRGLSLKGPFHLAIRSSGDFSTPQVNARASSPNILREDISLGAAQCNLVIRDRRLTLEGTLGDAASNGASVTGSMELNRQYPWSADLQFLITNADPSVLMKGSDILTKIRVSAQGRISLHGRAGGERQLAGDAVLQQAGILISDHRVVNEGEVSLHLENGALSIRRLVLTGTGTRLAVTGGAKVGKDVDLALAGEFDLSLLRLLYKEIEHGDGIANVRLSLRDDWMHPLVDGRVTVQDGMLKVRDVPQRFSGLSGTVLFDRQRITTEGLSADVGGGRITVIGSAQLRESVLYDFSLRTIVSEVTVHYPIGLTALLSGTLYYEGDRKEQTLSGELSIGNARYEKRIEWKSMLVDVTRGITRKKKTDIGWIGETQLNVRFTGSEDILFESNLAKIPIKIDMLFHGTVNQVQVLGRIEAREGEVYFRNNVFEVLYASADFVDPARINPVLDVQAETKVREYRIRLAVAGNADRAVVTFLSDPPLEDADILALLAVGRTGEELKGKEGAVGAGESLSFVSGKFQDLLESRARSLTGLDRFQIDPYINRMDTAVPRVTVGKEVVENRLFMTYSSNVGGTMPEQNLRMEYIVNRNVSLIGEYDELGQIGADLKFRFEFR